MRCLSCVRTSCSQPGAAAPASCCTRRAVMQSRAPCTCVHYGGLNTAPADPGAQPAAGTDTSSRQAGRQVGRWRRLTKLLPPLQQQVCMQLQGASPDCAAWDGCFARVAAAYAAWQACHRAPPPQPGPWLPAGAHASHARLHRPAPAAPACAAAPQLELRAQDCPAEACGTLN